MQVERREGYELQLVMVMATGCQWDEATLALKSQQPVTFSFTLKNNLHQKVVYIIWTNDVKVLESLVLWEIKAYSRKNTYMI